ncbi:polymorphic toxin type 50 domain-containing protein [Gilliamella sp. Bif1-4]|uniref:polymorphic toxin type 50 domain-containing protein n=1 Tax=Gilliamella sp. Bif1-4 TaxID=3120233 RepID=UPI00114621DB|nr:polymorphic toxin type 50 domain-containing protein [Gilliamella apicola]
MIFVSYDFCLYHRGNFCPLFWRGSSLLELNTALSRFGAKSTNKQFQQFIKEKVENNVATSQKGNKSSKFGEHAKNEKELNAGKGKNVSNPTVKPGANFAPGANPNLTVNMNQQNKHIVGTNEHKTANASASIPRSTIDSNIDVQQLVNNYAGTGSVKGKIPLGQPGSKENISANQFIGKYYDHNINIFVPTKNFTIHYSKKGVHIVPARP